jgi:LPS-assembly lipoprotein
VDTPRARVPGHWLFRVLLAASGALSSACGFHLEGRTPLPDVIKAAYVQTADAQTDFVQSLHKALLTSGVRPPASREEASAVVYVLKDEVVKRVLSVTASNQPSEYEVTYNVRFSVSSGDKELLPPQDVATKRSYSFDESLLLAKEHEEAILRQAMAHDLADIVMRQLSSL